MNKTKYAVSAALLIQSFAFAATPAFATVTTIGSAPTAAELQSACSALLKPNVNSGFMTAPKDVVTNTIGHTYTREFVSSVATGEPTLGGFEFGNLHVQNPNVQNIFADVVATEKTYPGSITTYHVHEETTYQVSFGCKVWKLVKKGEVVPPDQQVSGLLSNSWTVIDDHDETEVTGPVTVTLDPAELVEADKLVCNNPQDAWVNKGGYDGECSDDVFTSLGGVLPTGDNGNSSGGNGGGSGGGSNSGGNGNGGSGGNGGHAH